MPKFIRKRRSSTCVDAEHAPRAPRATPSPSSVAAPPRPRSAAAVARLDEPDRLARRGSESASPRGRARAAPAAAGEWNGRLDLVPALDRAAHDRRRRASAASSTSARSSYVGAHELQRCRSPCC